MKISKLFHWLYGILMLLPCFAILVKCAYVAFNKNAYESYSGTSTQYVQKTLQTNEVNSKNDLVIGNVYLLRDTYQNEDLFTFFGDNIVFDNNVYVVYLNEISNYYTDDVSIPTFMPLRIYSCVFYIHSQNSSLEISLGLSNDDNYQLSYINYKNKEDNFYIIKLTNDLYNQVGEDLFYFIHECPQEYLQYTTYYEEIEVSTLDNVFYYAVDEVCNNDLFAWASNSFLNAPLTYITNLFNMPTDNAVILLMSYWFNISIIWLCFDVMIYVPLLVHRWLDKGIVE